MAKNILIVAFHFPPLGGSSGLLRSLKFTKYLPKMGWRPTVLSVNRRVYDRLDENGLREIPQDINVIRAFGLDAKKHLSIRSRYPGWFALPDRWASWCLAAIPAGLRIVKRSKIDIIFTTFPIASAILIGLALHRITGKPWIVDFRDPMTEDGYPSDPLTWRIHRWIESQAMQYASLLIFTTESTRRAYENIYPSLVAGKSAVISNGYDESDFEGIQPTDERRNEHPLRLVHGGLVRLEERDPRPLFDAICRLRDEGKLRVGSVRVELRGSRSEDMFQAIIDELNIGEFVRLLPPLPYRQSLVDAANADALLVMQGQSCDTSIPAKVYEYLRLNKPILALTTENGDTASLLRQSGGATVANVHDRKEIAQILPRFLAQVESRSHALPNQSAVKSFSRCWQAKLLSDYLDGLLSASRQIEQ